MSTIYTYTFLFFSQHNLLIFFWHGILQWCWFSCTNLYHFIRVFSFITNIINFLPIHLSLPKHYIMLSCTVENLSMCETSQLRNWQLAICHLMNKWILVSILFNALARIQKIKTNFLSLFYHHFVYFYFCFCTSVIPTFLCYFYLYASFNFPSHSILYFFLLFFFVSDHHWKTMLCSQ